MDPIYPSHLSQRLIFLKTYFLKHKNKYILHMWCGLIELLVVCNMSTIASQKSQLWEFPRTFLVDMPSFCENCYRTILPIYPWNNTWFNNKNKLMLQDRYLYQVRIRFNFFLITVCFCIFFKKIKFISNYYFSVFRLFWIDDIENKF
jgi:hypothetical protein